VSTIKVNRIENTSTTDGGVSIDTDGHVTIDGQQLPTAGPLSNRNLIINGAMTVSQRSTSNAGQTATAYRACDRFQTGIDSLGTWTVSQAASAPAGFSKSLKMECTTANASPSAGSFAAIFYTIEAQDLQLLNYGTANAEVVQLSFWVRSNKTGSASFAVRQRDNSDKLFSKVYNFNSTADTWKKIEIEIPADTAGVINDDNGQGLTLAWWLNSGSNFTGGGATTGWEALDNTKRNPTNAGIGGTVNDYFEITGVQLEIGSKATPFEHESYGQTLAKCQRYYFRINGSDNINGLWGTGFAYSSDQAVISVPTPVTLRAAPTAIEQSGTAADYRILESGNTVTCTAVPAYGDDTTNNVVVAAFSTGNLTAGQGVMGRWNTGGNGYLAWSVEL
jgi:hypothetical protein